LNKLKILDYIPLENSREQQNANHIELDSEVLDTSHDLSDIQTKRDERDERDGKDEGEVIYK